MVVYNKKYNSKEEASLATGLTYDCIRHRISKEYPRFYNYNEKDHKYLTHMTENEIIEYEISVNNTLKNNHIERNSGTNNPMYGKSGKNSKLSKPFIINGILYHSLSEASKLLNVKVDYVRYRLYYNKEGYNYV